MVSIGTFPNQADSVDAALILCRIMGYPVVVASDYAQNWTRTVADEAQAREVVHEGLYLSPIGRVTLSKPAKG
jgi:hypothetical protein